MIFSNFFSKQANYKSKKNTVRILAINEELSKTADEQLLVSISNTDSDELVRRAALLKLACFSHWYDASNNNSNAKVKLFAQQLVQKYIQGQEGFSLSETDKQQLLCEKHNTAFLESWLYHETSPETVITVYSLLTKQSPKPQRAIQLFQQCKFNSVQNFLVSETDDVVQLERMLKKAHEVNIQQALKNKIQAIAELAEQPLKVRKQVQLLLSKYLALKDQTDFGYYQEKKSLLVQQWQESQDSLTCLSVDEQAVLHNKYQQIQQQLTLWFAPKFEAFEQAKIAKQLLDEKAQAKQNFAHLIKEIDQVLSDSVFENKPLDNNTFTAQLLELAKDINASVLSLTEQTSFLNQVKQQQQRLTQLPEIAESLTQATHHISKIAQLALPKTIDELNEREQTFNAWLSQWHVIEKKSNGILPESIKHAYQEVVTTWQAGLAGLKQQQNKHYHQCKKKLNDLKRLIAQGKYKASFGVFKGVKFSYTLLNEQQQQYLQRDFASVSEQMAELSDWEHYIATPRKQELLQEIKLLVNQPLDNPNEQAEKVKSYRKTWNLLGHADEAVDHDLNEQFNSACEQAFAPCRLFYAEQDKIRAQHVIVRKNIIEQVKVLSTSVYLAETTSETISTKPIDFKHIETELNKLEQQWRSAGDVDREQYKVLQRDFNKNITPIKQALKDFHQTNANFKLDLIKKAQQACLTDDVFSAIDTVKQLQTQWRDIGSAGYHQENKLWQTFRKANDEVFAKRDAIKVAQLQQKNEFETLQRVKLSAINNQYTSLEATDLSACTSLVDNCEVLLNETLTTKAVNKSLVNKIEKMLTQLKTKMLVLKQQQINHSWTALFQVFTLLAEEDFTLEATKTNSKAFAELTSFWQKKVVEYLKTTVHKSLSDNEQRANQVLEIEIIAGKESPKAFAQQRLAIQVTLMQQQMTSGATVDLSKNLVKWLQLGKLQNSDKTLIERLKIVYCS